MIRINKVTVPLTGHVGVAVVGKTVICFDTAADVIMSVIDPSGLDEDRYINFGVGTFTTPLDFGPGCQVFFRMPSTAPEAGTIRVMTNIASGDPVGVV